MPPFQYQQYRNPYVGSISDLIMRPGEAQAAAAERIGQIQAQSAQQQGNAWAGAANQTGQAISGAIQQATDPRRQLEQQQVAQNTRIQNMNAAAAGIAKQATRPDGTTNYDFLRNGMAQLSIDPAIQDRVLKSAESFDAHASQAANNTKESHADLGHMLFQALNGLPKDAPPQAVDAVVSSAGGLAKAQKVATDEELQQIFGQVHTRDDAMRIALGFMGSSPSKRYAEELKPIVSPAGAAVTMPGQAPTIPAPKAATAASLADAAHPNDPSGALAAIQSPEVNAQAIAAAAHAETARHNTEMEKISRMTQGREAAAQAETARHNRETEKTSALAANPFGLPTAGSPQASSQTAIPQTQGPTGDEFLKTLAPGIASEVKAYAEGKRPFPTGMSYAKLQPLIQLVSQYDPSFDASNYNARNKVRTDLESPSGTGGKTINALNTALQHAGKLSDLIENMDNYEIPLANTVVNPLRTALGKTEVTNFKAVAPQLMKEIERAWRGTGGSSADIKELIDSISSSAGKQQQREALSQFVDLVKGKLDSTAQQRDNALGPIASQGIPILFDQNKPVMDKIAQRATGAVPAAARELVWNADHTQLVPKK